MDVNAIALLSCKVQLVHYAADTTVHTQGSSGDSAFIVVAGSCKVCFFFSCGCLVFVCMYVLCFELVDAFRI